MRDRSLFTLVVVLVAGSAGSARAESQPQVEDPAKRAEEEARWRERVPLGPAGGDCVRVPGDLAARDPHPEIVHEGATVFSGGQIYLWIAPPLEDLAVARDSTRWFFFPGGRFLVRFRRGLRDSEEVSRNEFWGRYRVTAEEAVEIETDDGGADVLRLTGGRRYLEWEETRFEAVAPEEKEGEGR